MGANNADFRGIPEHKSITMMSPTEILATAHYDGITPEELDKENSIEGLDNQLAGGYDQDKVRVYGGETQHVTILYPKNGGKPVIGDGNHRVRALSKIAPSTPIPVMHWRSGGR